MRIYIAGPMTGLPDSNYPAFHAAAAAWREAGWEVENPAEHFDGAEDLPYRQYVEADLTELRKCDAIAMLPGWDGPNARGSVWEREIALQLLKIPVYDAAHPIKVMPPTVGEFIRRVNSYGVPGWHDAVENSYGKR